MIREAIVKLVNKENLTYEMAEGAMDEIMGGKADPIQISAFLTAMTMKGETIEEITACANGMRKHGVPMEHDKDVLEIVGTGGDKSNSFNISTTASLVISAGGVAVAKHGNRRRHRADPAQPTVSKRSASKSTWSRRKTKKFWKNLESVSCSHRNTTCP